MRDEIFFRNALKIFLARGEIFSPFPQNVSGRHAVATFGGRQSDFQQPYPDFFIRSLLFSATRPRCHSNTIIDIRSLIFLIFNELGDSWRIVKIKNADRKLFHTDQI